MIYKFLYLRRIVYIKMHVDQQLHTEKHHKKKKHLVGGLVHFPYLGNIIIPMDFHIFQRGRLNHQPDML